MTSVGHADGRAGMCGRVFTSNWLTQVHN